MASQRAVAYHLSPQLPARDKRPDKEWSRKSGDNPRVNARPRLPKVKGRSTGRIVICDAHRRISIYPKPSVSNTESDSILAFDSLS